MAKSLKKSEYLLGFALLLLAFSSVLIVLMIRSNKAADIDSTEIPVTAEP
jgi:hypothetical protein